MSIKTEKQLFQLSRRHLSLWGKAIILNTLILLKITFSSNIFPIPPYILKQIHSNIFKHIWQFSNKEPISRETLFLPKTQAGIGLIEPKPHSLAMKIKHFPILKEEQTYEHWTLFRKYMLAAFLYRLHKDFRYLISNNTLKADQSKINFYYEDIVTYIKKYLSILNNPKNLKIIYKTILKEEYQNYTIIGQPVWD